jgi:hypothetical protein
MKGSIELRNSQKRVQFDERASKQSSSARFVKNKQGEKLLEVVPEDLNEEM